MKTKQLVKYFGNVSAAAKGINVSRVTIYNWEKLGKIPVEVALTLDYLTEGRLEFREKDYPELKQQYPGFFT